MAYRLLLTLLLLPLFLSADIVTFSGHIGSKELQKAQAVLNETEETLYLSIDSSSGDLRQTLDFAKALYEKKISNGIQVIVYIDGSAIGPAAVLPFLADERYASLYASWGDIPLGSDEVLPPNILRNQVLGLITDDNELLRLVARGMADPQARIVDDGGWKLGESGRVVSEKGETLVLNQREMESLGLVKGLLSEAQFRQRFKLAEEKDLEQAEQSPLAVKPSTLEEEFARHITVKRDGKNVIGHILIDDRTTGISQATWIYVKKALDHYKEIKPDFIILELNTPGGEVFASQRISDALKEMDTQYGIPVVAFVNNWAISAGAMLAYSSRFITVVKDGSMGAAEPVIPGEGGEMKSASEKVNSALRADFANRARFFDRNPDIAEAMVDKDIILVYRHGDIVRLASEDQIRKKGPDPDVVITNKGKLLTLSAEELIRFGVADVLLLPKKIPPITEAEKSAGKWPAEKMLLFHTPFFDQIPDAVVDSYQMDWKTRFFATLATPMVSSLLFLGMMLGLYMEFNSPGFGVPGTVGVTCLFLIVLSSFALEIGNWLELALVVIGLAMLLVEIFVLPSFGLLGFIGLLFFMGGLVGLMLPGLGNIDYEYETGTFNPSGEIVLNRLAWFGGTIVVAFFLMILLGRYVMPRFTGYSRLILSGSEQDASAGYYAGSTPEQLPSVGDRGVVKAPLRTAGSVLINGKFYDATSEGSFIESGVSVIVTRIDGHVIFVAELSNE